MNKQQRYKVLQSIMWDYSISPGDMEKLLNGKIEKAGHYTREKLFAKDAHRFAMVYYYPAFTGRKYKDYADR